MTDTSSSMSDVSEALINSEALRKRKGPKISFKENRAWKFPEEPKEFSEKWPQVRWGSKEHDELGKRFFKSKSSNTHSDEFPKHFPRFSLVKKNKRAFEPYARRRTAAFLRRCQEQEAISAAKEAAQMDDCDMDDTMSEEGEIHEEE